MYLFYHTAGERSNVRSFRGIFALLKKYWFMSKNKFFMRFLYFLVCKFFVNFIRLETGQG